MPGCLLGIVFVKSEVLSWYRIQEMFRFQSPHMYLVIASAFVVATAQHSGSAVARPSHFERRSDHDSAERDDPSRRSILAWRHGLRSGVGAAGCVPGADLRTDRCRRDIDECRAAQRVGRDMALRRDAIRDYRTRPHVNNLTILQINDLHGYLAPHAELFDLGASNACSPVAVSRVSPRSFENIRRDVDHARAGARQW